MLYETYQAHTDAWAPFRMIALAAQGMLNQPWPLMAQHPLVRSTAAACEMMARAGMWHDRPVFRIHLAEVAGHRVAVREEVVRRHPFCNLLHFRKEAIDGPAVSEQPRVLVVAPLSGHFATLLRGTVETLLPDHDVYITDWINARNVPLLHGRFDLDDYIDLVAAFIRELRPELNVIAVCQPSVPVLAAVSLLAAEDDPDQPRTLTLMGGPIDTRVNPTKVNLLATSRPLSWFERNVVASVPARYHGAFRRVYPGFLQLAGFMSMNLDRHFMAHVDFFHHLVRGDGESAAATRKFYDEFMSVMDMPADFYLQTVKRVFHDHALPLGTFVSRGRRVEPAAITRTAVLTIEGENDDICAVGQTAAAHALLSGLAPAQKARHVQPQVGHFGVFNGRRWRDEIYPLVRDFIRAQG
ncbi:MAG TPA: polyhydroxyalkanoate depolymerase [Stellaceae bacterium]|nr:polyhydroxyalkanoate depolymerase [Stellaceae bacterium]